jgi:ATP-binding cassette, subfamily B, bacterial
MKKITFYKQLNAMDCGPTCLRMVAKSHGRHYNTDVLRKMAGFSKDGVSLLGISDTAEKIGFRTRGVKITFEQLKDVPRPCILHWDQNHFVVLVKITRRVVHIADPAVGIITLGRDKFLNHWASSQSKGLQDTGVVLILEPTPAFYEQESQRENKLSWNLALQYLRNAKGQIVRVFTALIITSLISLILPFLTQSIVDTGINTQNLQFVFIILIAQLMLTFS